LAFLLDVLNDHAPESKFRFVTGRAPFVMRAQDKHGVAGAASIDRKNDVIFSPFPTAH
jgi:hypothetical protein